MKTSAKYALLICILAFLNSIYPQKALQILNTRYGKFRKYELYAGEPITFKLKGEHRYHTYRLSNMNERGLLLNDSFFVEIANIKAIKLNNRPHILGTLTAVPVYIAFGYPFLNVANNLILNEVFKIDQRAVVISGICVGAYLILSKLGYKRLRMGEHVMIKIADLNFRNMASGDGNGDQ